MALEHHRDAGLEELGRVAPMEDGDVDALALDVEGDVAGRLVDGAPDDDAFDPKPPVAEALALGHRLVGRAEVQRRVAEATHDEEPESSQDHDARHDQAAAARSPLLRGGYGHRWLRPSGCGGSSRASALLRATTQAAYPARTPKVTPYPPTRYPTWVMGS